MTDVFTPSKRSMVMAQIKGTGNRDTELRLAKRFRHKRIIGWRRGVPLFGKPDFVFPKLKLAVFVDGCFWHACPIHATQPKSNAEFWTTKIAKNVARDRLVNRTLRAQGWRVMRIWEHELTRKYEKRLLARLKRVGLLPVAPEPDDNE